ncbi:MAG: glycosyltransferase family 2 protein [Kiritimatiellaeota bacterium]|nr:glycosyltransferase family 2 protein [Kiritimatiellota bacterium]
MSSLSIVIPAHNEGATVTEVVEEVWAIAQQLGLDYEIILVNDGSTDQTGPLAHTLMQRIAQLHLVEYFPGRNYGGALKAGFGAATKELIAFFPADKQFVFSDIVRLLERSAAADIVSGYRANRQDNFIRKLNAWSWNTLIKMIFGSLGRDIDCGFKLFRRDILNHVKLVSDGAMLDTELLAGAKACGYGMAEVEVTHLPRTAGRATGAKLIVIVRAVRDLLRFRRRFRREMCGERS